jgi:hypothetical protein
MLLLAHCFQRTCNLDRVSPFLSIADAKVHTFLFHATLFLKYFLKIFYPMIINRLDVEIFPEWPQKVPKSVPSKAFFVLCPPKFYANATLKSQKVINFIKFFTC